MNLTAEQLTVARATEPRIRVKALAGTGKTHTAVHRIIEQRKMGRKVSRVFTFTKSAAETISMRLSEAGIYDVPVSTLHRYAWDQVNTYRHSRGLDDIEISDGSQIVQQIYFDEYERGASTREIEQVRQMSTLLLNGATYAFRTSENKAELKHLVEQYRIKKKAWEQFDWDDLIIFASGVATKRGTTIDGEVIIDEAQDLTQLQMRYIENLKPERLTLILDPNQNIFGFAGVEQVASTAKNFTEYTLSKSFRTAQNILDLANELIPERLTSNIKDSRGRVRWVQTTAETQTEDVLKMLKPGDCVISRFKASAREVQKRFNPELALHYPINSNVPVENSFYGFGSIHWAKGQEWERVFILNVTENGFAGLPMTEEEKRIMYVAITRARGEVILMNLTKKRPRWFTQ